MNNMLEYKGYFGTVDFSAIDNVLYGKVLGIRSLISFEGESLHQLKEDFEGAIDDYLDDCQAKELIPEKAYRGSFNVRVSPELHKDLAHYSSSIGQSLNSTVEEAIRQYVKGSGGPQGGLVP